MKTSELGFKASGKGRGIENILIGGVAVAQCSHAGSEEVKDDR